MRTHLEQLVFMTGNMLLAKKVSFQFMIAALLTSRQCPPLHEQSLIHQLIKSNHHYIKLLQRSSYCVQSRSLRLGDTTSKSQTRATLKISVTSQPNHQGEASGRALECQIHISRNPKLTSRSTVNPKILALPLF